MFTHDLVLEEIEFTGDEFNKTSNIIELIIKNSPQGRIGTAIKAGVQIWNKVDNKKCYLTPRHSPFIGPLDLSSCPLDLRRKLSREGLPRREER